MTDFMAKMHQIRFRLMGLRPRPRCMGELTALPRPLSWIWGLLLKEGEGRGGEGNGRGGEGAGEEGRAGKGRGGEGKGSVSIVPVLRNDH